MEEALDLYGGKDRIIHLSPNDNISIIDKNKIKTKNTFNKKNDAIVTNLRPKKKEETDLEFLNLLDKNEDDAISEDLENKFKIQTPFDIKTYNDKLLDDLSDLYKYQSDENSIDDFEVNIINIFDIIVDVVEEYISQRRYVPPTLYKIYFFAKDLLKKGT